MKEGLPAIITIDGNCWDTIISSRICSPSEFALPVTFQHKMSAHLFFVSVPIELSNPNAAAALYVTAQRIS